MATTPTDRRDADERKRKRAAIVKFSLAGAAVLGIGAAATSALWTDDAWFAAEASAVDPSTAIDLQGAYVGTTATPQDSDFATADDEPGTGTDFVTIPAEVFADALGRSEAMRAALAKFTESLLAQVQQTAACNAQHRLDERLARWLLTIHDRADADRFALTQADIADMLGVRRATVSEVGSALEDRGLIRRGRGWVQVLDRRALEKASCGCYALMRGVMQDLGVPRPNGRH